MTATLFCASFDINPFNLRSIISKNGRMDSNLIESIPYTSIIWLMELNPPMIFLYLQIRLENTSTIAGKDLKANVSAVLISTEIVFLVKKDWCGSTVFSVDDLILLAVFTCLNWLVFFLYEEKS